MICREIVTADVLVQGLSHGAIAARKFKGVKRDKGHEDYTASAPYDEGKSLLQLRWNHLGFRWPGAKPLCLAIDLVLLALNRHRVAPLYRKVNAQQLSEYRPAHKPCPARTLNYSCLTLQVTPQWRFTTTGLKPPLSLRPITKPSSLTCPWASEWRAVAT